MYLLSNAYTFSISKMALEDNASRPIKIWFFGKRPMKRAMSRVSTPSPLIEVI